MLPWSDFTPWIQDCFLVAERGGAALLLGSPRVDRPGGGADEAVTAIVAKLGRSHQPIVKTP